MKVENKLQNIKLINDLGLNKFPEQLFKSGEESKVKKFLEQYPAQYYAIRDNLRLVEYLN